MKDLKVATASCKQRSKGDEQLFLISAKCLFKMKILAFEKFSKRVCMSEEIVEDTGLEETGNVKGTVSGPYYSSTIESFITNAVSEIKQRNITEEDPGRIVNYNLYANNGNIRTQSKFKAKSVVTMPIGQKQPAKCQKEGNDRFAHFAERFCSRSSKIVVMIIM